MFEIYSYLLMLSLKCIENRYVTENVIIISLRNIKHYH